MAEQLLEKEDVKGDALLPEFLRRLGSQGHGL